jgi:hypothetical protein
MTLMLGAWGMLCVTLSVAAGYGLVIWWGLTLTPLLSPLSSLLSPLSTRVSHLSSVLHLFLLLLLLHLLLWLLWIVIIPATSFNTR